MITVFTYFMIYDCFEEYIFLTLLAGGVRGEDNVPQGYIFSRPLERKMILNQNCVTFNIILWRINC